MASRLPTETVPDQWCFKIVAALDESEPELKVRFIGDTSAMAVSNTQERWSVLRHLSMSLRHAIPIGVQFGQGNCVTGTGTLIFVEVLEVGESTRFPHLSRVELGGEAAPRYLAKQQAGYEERRRQLTEAAATRGFVWCVIQGATIVDVKVLSHEEDDILCRWMREHAQRAEATRLENRCST